MMVGLGKDDGEGHGLDEWDGMNGESDIAWLRGHDPWLWMGSTPCTSLVIDGVVLLTIAICFLRCRYIPQRDV